MKKTLVLYLLLVCSAFTYVKAAMADTTVLLDAVEVSGKLSPGPSHMAKSTFQTARLFNEQLHVLKDVSVMVPNLYLPDYGSRMTSATYVRGMGARMDQPVLGMLVDGLPIFNKNVFDGRVGDLVGITVLRGPQSTLFGRNTMGGVISLQTLSPRDYQGTRVRVGYANAHTLDAQISHYRQLDDQQFVSFSGYGGRSDGLFTNTYDNRAIDAYVEAGARMRLERVGARKEWVNNLSFSWLDQTGYPYRQWENGQLAPIRYNEETDYRRLTLNEGFTAAWQIDDHRLTSATTYQFSSDRMRLDQDFTALDYFTILQGQHDHLLNEDLTVLTGRRSDWVRLTGLNVFLRHLTTTAPVTFKRYGIEQLILANANRGLQQSMPGAEIQISDSSFVLASDFQQPSLGAALYHQSTFKRGDWLLTAGMRLDFELAHLQYINASALHYRFTMTMPGFKRLETNMDGKETLSFLEWLPSLAATWSPSSSLLLSASLSKGFKAGGFNTQLFSDILKHELTTDLMNDLGVYVDGVGASYAVADVVTYKPEHSWNYELKLEVKPLKGWNLTATTFYIDCRDQQLTVFPDGQNTGRMMTNAGRTSSMGAELETTYARENRTWRLSYGHTDARFVRYHNGVTDYAGQRIPFAPQHTFHAAVDQSFPSLTGWLDKVHLHLGYGGCGPIWWTENNDVKQHVYGLLDASLSLSRQRLTLQLWGKNLSNTDYTTFYFVSMGHAFLQKGKPLQTGLTLSWRLDTSS
jgi:outer membrane receptor protein involved in Fe transport